MPGNTCKCNAGVIDLTGGSDDERIESSRNNSGGLRRPNKQSRQAGKFNDIEITKATIQTSCTVCLKKFETRVRNHDKNLVVRSCTISCTTKLAVVHDRARIVRDKNRARQKSCATKIVHDKNRAGTGF